MANESSLGATNGEDDLPEYHDRHSGMTRPVLAYADLPKGRLKDLSPADRIVAGIAWLADNSEHGIDDAAKKLIDEFRALAVSESGDSRYPCPNGMGCKDPMACERSGKCEREAAPSAIEEHKERIESQMEAARMAPTLEALYRDLGTLKWIGSDQGWELAIKAVRADIEERLKAAPSHVAPSIVGTVPAEESHEEFARQVEQMDTPRSSTAPHADLVYRLRERARIRRQIPGRKSVQEGAPDRIADLLDEAAAALSSARSAIAPSDQPEHVCGLQGYNPMIDPLCPGCAVRLSDGGAKA